MNPEPLYLRNGLPSGIWFCAKCRHVHPDPLRAEACCVPVLCECGEPVAPGWSVCWPCREGRDRAREQERFEKAEKIHDWGGPVFHGDTFYACVEDAMENLDDTPTYFWPAVGKPFVELPLDSVLMLFEDEAYEDFDTGDLKGVAELKAALNAFEVANQELVGFEPDYARAVTP